MQTSLWLDYLDYRQCIVIDRLCLWNPVHTGNEVEFNTVDFVESRLLPKPATNRQQSQLLRYTVGFVADTVDFVADTVNIVTGVYGAKAKSPFHKVDRIEFNFVASVYRALLYL